MVSLRTIGSEIAAGASKAMATVKAYPRTTAAVAALATGALVYATGFAALSTCTTNWYGSASCTPTLLGSGVNAVFDNPKTSALAAGATLASAAAAKYLPSFLSIKFDL